MSSASSPNPISAGIEQLNENGDIAAANQANVASMQVINPALANYWAEQANLAPGATNPNLYPPSIQWETFSPSILLAIWPFNPGGAAKAAIQTATVPIPAGIAQVAQTAGGSLSFIPQVIAPVVPPPPGAGVFPVNITAQQQAQAQATQSTSAADNLMMALYQEIAQLIANQKKT